MVAGKVHILAPLSAGAAKENMSLIGAAVERVQVQHLDGVAQQNSALVEQTAAAAESQRHQAPHKNQALAFFWLAARWPGSHSVFTDSDQRVHHHSASMGGVMRGGSNGIDQWQGQQQGT